MIKKCFWKGHNASGWKDGDSFCTYCGTTATYKTTLGESILEILDTVKRILIGIFLFILAIAVLFAVVQGIATPISYFSCKEFAEQNSLSFIYKFFYGCLVNYNGHWISPESLVQLLK